MRAVLARRAAICVLGALLGFACAQACAPPLPPLPDDVPTYSECRLEPAREGCGVWAN